MIWKFSFEPTPRPPETTCLALCRLGRSLLRCCSSTKRVWVGWVVPRRWSAPRSARCRRSGSPRRAVYPGTVRRWSDSCSLHCSVLPNPLARRATSTDCQLASMSCRTCSRGGVVREGCRLAVAPGGEMVTPRFVWDRDDEKPLPNGVGGRSRPAGSAPPLPVLLRRRRCVFVVR